MEKMRFIYVTPSTQIHVWENCQCILGHSENTGDVGEDDEFNAKEGNFDSEETETVPASPNLWGDEEE